MIRWLHISDVHECKQDDFHRVGMYEAIVAEVKAQSNPPDIVFFTGDLAFAGTAFEYKLLKDRLLVPLREASPLGCPLFTVPGNHDVDRKRASRPRIWIRDADEHVIFQKVDGEGCQKRSDLLLPRFEAYRATEREVAAWGTDWLASEQGSICKVIDAGGKRIAVVGINTAWLCQDDGDWGRLTAGKDMVDAALRQAKVAAPDLVIALGHHPLAAMSGEMDWSDGDRIRKRLEQANAIYLHGHLHDFGSQLAGDAMQSVLAIQAPSGFQAADSKKWRNGLLWGEVDLKTGQLLIWPKRWNDDNQEYVFDSDAVHSRRRVQGKDAFAFGLPGHPDPPPNFTFSAALDATAQESPKLPEGWEVIDAEALASKTAQRPSPQEMSDWFDGQFPRWEVALAEGVRPRHAVEEVARRFEAAHHEAPLPITVLLTGAGGEGKSAALLQIAARLVGGGHQWTCLWRSAAAATSVSDDLFAKLERQPNHAWIVAIDDAENVGHALPTALQRIQPRTDVHLILAARDADWSIYGLTDGIWHGVAAFNRIIMAGLDADDARRIADGWVAYGPTAMGRLQGSSVEQAANALLGHAQEHAARKEEGALLGALLITRQGEDLKGRVIRLMEPWNKVEGIGAYSLRDVYAAIAAMHAENQLFLSRAVLAYALRCDEVALDRGPLRILRREAMVDSGTTYVLTRHRRIAETARDWLIEAGYDVDRWYSILASAALRHFLRTHPKFHDIANWCNELRRHFVDGGPSRWHVAAAVTKALFEADPDDPMRITAYASTLRRIEQPGTALTFLREQAPRFPRDRGMLLEWSVVAGQTGDSGLDAWLAARSLADDRRAELVEKQCKLSLAGLGAAFRGLWRTTGRQVFAHGQAACGRLGLRLTALDSTARKYMEEYARASPPTGDKSAILNTDINTLRTAAIKASEETEPSNDPRFFERLIGDPEIYRYTMLAAVLSDQDRNQSDD